MRIFKRSNSTTPVADQFLGDAALRHVNDRLVAGSWSELEELLSRRADGWLVQSLIGSDETNVPVDVFRDWSKQSPSALSLTMLGNAQTIAAWAIRGRAYAKDVEGDAWPRFFAGLEVAEATLWRAVAMDSGSADPWAVLMTTARGLQLEKDELARRFDSCHERAPFRPDACRTMMQGLCKKWSGSNEAMFEFARWIESDAPSSSPARSLLPLAHFEFAVAEKIRPSQHFGQPAVSAELTAAASSYLEATTDPPQLVDYETLNNYVLALQPINHASATVLVEIVRRIDGVVSQMPWTYYTEDCGPRYRAVSKERLGRAKRYI